MTTTQKITRSVLTLALVGAGLAVASPAVADVATGSACTGVADCRAVASADVDGDGLLDDVALAPGTDENSVQVRVLTSSGELATHEVPVDAYATQNLGVDPWFGSAQIDERPGDELVLTSSVGAHTTFSTVLSSVGGELVELPAPGSSPTDDPGLTRWVVDGSASSNVGVTVERPGVVTIRSAVTAWEPQDAPVFDATEQTWISTDGVWTTSGPVSESTPPVDAALPQGFSGWHAIGLPVR